MVGKEEVKSMKKILSFVLACMLSVSCFAVNANAVSMGMLVQSCLQRSCVHLALLI